MTRPTTLCPTRPGAVLLLGLLVAMLLTPVAVVAAPEGQLTWAVHVTLAPTFPNQWDAKAPWHDRRVRQATNHAVDRPAINRAETLGFSKITGSIIPSTFDFYWQPPLWPYDPARVKQLLAEAGYAGGFDAGDYVYGSYPDLDGLFRDQASEPDRKKREVMLHRVQQLVHDKAMFASIWELASLNGVGPGVEESGLGLIAGHAYSASYEDLRVRK